MPIKILIPAVFEEQLRSHMTIPCEITAIDQQSDADIRAALYWARCD